MHREFDIGGQVPHILAFDFDSLVAMPEMIMKNARQT